MNRIRRYTQRQSRQVDYLYKHNAKYMPGMGWFYQDVFLGQRAWLAVNRLKDCLREEACTRRLSLQTQLVRR